MDLGEARATFEHERGFGSCHVLEKKAAEVVLLDQPSGEAGLRGREVYGLAEEGQILLGQASILASQPEFTSGERMRSLLELTEKRDVLGDALSSRDHQGGLRITIGGENDQEELSDFTLVTSEYRIGGLKGVIGVIGPTRMPYEKIIAIVDSTSSLVNRILGS